MRRTVGGGGAQTRLPAMMDRGCLKRKERLMLQSEGIKEGRLNKMNHHWGKGISLIEGE